MSEKIDYFDGVREHFSTLETQIIEVPEWGLVGDKGVTKALATGNIPMAILIGALGAVQIATIAQQKYQGRRLGGRMNQDQPYLVGEAGPELVVPDRASNVVPNGQLGNMGKQVNVNFHITTVDATGFSELLVNSRATIVNVINQALNEKGKEVLV